MMERKGQVVGELFGDREPPASGGEMFARQVPVDGDFGPSIEERHAYVADRAGASRRQRRVIALANPHG